jgi:fatty-acid peroxygenase
MGERTICMLGEEAARIFCDPQKFVRAGAMPSFMLATLFGFGTIHGLDDAPHACRKRMFMSMVTDKNHASFATIFERWLTKYARRWASGGKRLLFYEALHEPLTGAICEWVGVPLKDDSDLVVRTKLIAALFDDCASFPSRHILSRLSRYYAEEWIAHLVSDIRRSGAQKNNPQDALHTIAWHRDVSGELLSPRIAAVEVLNLLRPTVAASIFVTHAAVLLHQHPEVRERLRKREPNFSYYCAQEVRRMTPFAPALPARVRNSFTWRDKHFSKGMQVVLAIYGTNHDPRLWAEPEKFNPDRFKDWQDTQYNFIPQGPGDANVHHRCPGEGIATEVLKVALDHLACKWEYDVPTRQDFDIDWMAFPALPKHHMIIQDIRLFEDKKVD